MKAVNQHVPQVAKIGRATMHSPLPDDLSADLIKATSILEHFIKGTNQVDSALIPPRVIANAKGIAVITILKAGFLWSGRAGSGIVVAKLSNGGWSAPSAIAAGGAGFGAQIGAQLTDCVFILNNEAAVKAFSHGGNLTFGGAMSVAAGPKGRQAEAAGAVLNLAPIYSYSKSKGLFAGVSLEGSIIITRNDANRALYGRKVSPKELLSGEVAPPVQAEALYRVLDLKFGNMGTGVQVKSAYAERVASQRASSAPPIKKGGANRVGAAAASGGGFGTLKGAASATTVSPPAAVSPSDSFSRKAVSATAAVPPPPPVAPRKPNPAAAAAAQTRTALYDFNGERPSDLSFKQGDVITVVKAGGPEEWWVGRINGKEGEFPATYTS
ncbi:hypothetical protein HDU87_006267 [Geranomyces variabilis]|uniref:SH3 domain-containing protein n=1 Tax=Geranomyces variabilis TaxID=109894 RepID=A0AAD5TGW1_9FUNG|nr:hypothetical protein HDU87_006267 [Geranomyces variabilis]